MAGSTSGRCRVCTANDQETLIEQLAEQVWEWRRERDFPHWAEAGEFWQAKFREHALLFVNAARG
ncbi:hypothetical protein [Sphingomonas aerophila]|uniref:Uncharacterized protein n=1 Tax=Sphingomonas aerophila TaxID=1344948 RepID=A0A7W9BCQ0_9SPHN|nr:hypothetical protein [Sphingomonas aerophila]MBB5714777.1 hypothetical protein [Sphingomonas aerophila]